MSAADLLVPGTVSYPGWLTTSHPDNVTLAPIDDIIHPYWKQFDISAIPDSYHYMVAAWMTFFGILGVLGNLLVIWTFCSAKHLRTPPNMLLVNLAIGDMTFAAVNGFPLLTISSINKKWVWGKTWCEVYGFVGGIFGLLSIITLAIVAMDRHYVIAKPLMAAKRMSHKKAFLYILFAWFWSAVWTVPPFFGWGHYIPEGFQTSCTFDYLTQDLNNITQVTGMYIGAFVIPVAIIFYCYIGIVKAIFLHHKEMKSTAKRMGATMSREDENKRQEIQAAKVAAITVGSFLCSWTPYAIVALVGMVTPHERMIITPLLSEIPVMFAKASASYNPIIYALSHPKFRIEIHKRFPWLLCCCKPAAIKRSDTSRSDLSRTGSVMSKTEAESVTDTVEMSRAPSQQTVATVADSPAANPASGTPQSS